MELLPQRIPLKLNDIQRTFIIQNEHTYIAIFQCCSNSQAYVAKGLLLTYFAFPSEFQSFMIHPPEFFGNRFIKAGRNLDRNVREFCLQLSISYCTFILSYCLKCYNMGPPALLPLRM
jgi:hypothetical protein